jgi:hypothetical protein
VSSALSKAVTRTIKSASDLNMAVAFLQNQSVFPLQMVLKPGKEPRSAQQNRLAFQWYKDAADQGDHTAAEYRCLCKLHFGIPIMREDDEFRAKYDAVIKPLAYEIKLALMDEPFNFPVTSLMSVKQFTRYLDRIWHHFTSKGFRLTDPAMLGIDDYSKWEREMAA